MYYQILHASTVDALPKASTTIPIRCLHSQLAENYMAKFQKMFLDVLDKGNFVELDQSIINTSYGSAGFLGTGMAVRWRWPACV